MTILYLHGFASSHATGTVELLQRALPLDTIIAPDIPVDPTDALPFLADLCRQQSPHIIIGTSMGGMYAQQLRAHTRILVNPAFAMSSMSRTFRAGTYTFLHKRHDGAKTFRVDKELIQKHCAMERLQFKDITPEEQRSCWCLVGLHDTVVTNAEATFRKHYLADHLIRFDGAHALTDAVVRKYLLPLVEQLRPELEGQA